MLQVTNSQLVWQFFHAELGLHASEDFRGVCHVPEVLAHKRAELGDVAVAVGYNGFIGRTCCMHVVIKRPELFSRRILRESFHYAFVACGCEAVLALVDSTNKEALDLDVRLGFKEIARVPNGGLDGDLIVLQMLRAECRWLRAH